VVAPTGEVDGTINACCSVRGLTDLKCLQLVPPAMGLFISRKFLENVIVEISLLFDKYYLIMD
jgi:hypothetical protein